MVGLPRTRQPFESIRSLPELLLGLCKNLQSKYAVQFDVHFQSGLSLDDCSQQTARLISISLEQAAVAASPLSTIDVAIHSTRRGVEIEVVATSTDSNPDSLRAFCREQILIGNGRIASLYRARCPEGSMAWIVVQSESARWRRQSC